MTDPARATIKDIAAALGVPERTAQHQASTGGWVFEEEVLPTGAKRRVYPVDQLPAKVRDALATHALATATPALPAAKTEAERRLALAEQGKAPARFEDWQRQIRDARLILAHEVDSLAGRFGLTRGGAIDRLVDMAKKGELSAELTALVPVANARNGKERGKGTRTLSRTSLYRWFRVRDEVGPDALAAKAPPKPSQKKENKWWHAWFLRWYARPQKPSIAWCLEEMAKEFPAGCMAELQAAGLAPEDVELPGYSKVRRFLDRLSAQQRDKGRMGPRDMKRQRAYTARDVAELYPGCVYSADGHTFDAEVSHPKHGQPFRPEVTPVADIYSRRIVGWSAGVVEKTATVADAMLNAFTTVGPCDIWYVDRGKGFNNEVMDNNVTGILARAGVLKENSLPYNSQARGVVERIHKSVWVRAAKALPTYMGLDMDREARQLAYKITRGEIKQTGTSQLLPSWEATLQFLTEQVDAYNNRPHSELPKTRDSETGRVRNMTPNEMWAAGVEVHGALAPLAETEALAAFRPQERRKTERALVSLWGNSYFHRDLEPYHGEFVRVSYDIHDAGMVWVYAMDGRFLCQAVFEGNKRAYFAVTKASIDDRKRTEGRLRRVQVQFDEIQAEANPPLVIDHQPEEPLTLEALEVAEAEFARLERRDGPAEPVPCAASEDGERPKFLDDETWVRWVLDNPDQALPADRAELRRRLRDRSFRMLLEMQGLDVGALSALAA